MSLELKIEALTEAVIELTNAMREKAHVQAAPAPLPVGAVVAAPVPYVPAPVAPAPAPAVVVPVPAPAAPVVPSTPSFAVPFDDAKGLTSYCMKKYSELGPVKGGNIQGVLTSIGCKNLSEVTPDKYADFYTKVEAL